MLRIRAGVRLSSIPIQHRCAHCVGCGGNLIAPLSRTRAAPIMANDGAEARSASAASEIVSQMSPAQREALNWSRDEATVSRHELRHSLQAAKSKSAHKSQLCKPCVMTRAGTTTELTIPRAGPALLGKQFHVIDAMDFPAGVPFEELEASSSGNHFVISRCDLLVPTHSQLPKVKRYAMKTVFGPMGVPEDRVHTVSSKYGWNLEKLSEAFVGAPKQNYFVGAANAGKTSLVHALAGVSQTQSGPTTWPVPFTTQYPTEFRSLPKYRVKKIVDMPSQINLQAPSGLGVYGLLPASTLRKVGTGVPMIRRDPKYTVSPIRARSGQTVSIGGILGIEFPRLPERQLPIHVFPLVGGIAHTEFGQAFRGPEKLAEINTSADPNHAKMRMHAEPGLALERIAEFKLLKNGERQSLVVKGLGVLQPFLFGAFPEGYAAVVHAPHGTEVTTRPEILPYLF